jgi:hypothetical protein
MKTLSKHFHIPEMHFHVHINPIYRDVVTVVSLGLLVAVAVLVLVVMFISQF